MCSFNASGYGGVSKLGCFVGAQFSCTLSPRTEKRPREIQRVRVQLNDDCQENTPQNDDGNSLEHELGMVSVIEL